MKKTVKEVKIGHCTYHMDDTQWYYEIILLNTKPIYRADLYILDDYDGYSGRWKNHESSPEFATEEEAEAFAIKTWVG